jgi:hypothetical protein
MSPSSARHFTGVQQQTVRLGIFGAIVAMMIGWLLVAFCLAAMISFGRDTRLAQAACIVILYTVSQGAIWATRQARASIRLRAMIPQSLLDRRLHGNLDAITDSAGKSLRSVGVGASAVAASTGSLLTKLIEMPQVYVFHGIQATASRIPVAHAVAAGRTLILVESVAWPPGEYRTDADGRIRCDGRYIGQSVAPLIAAVRQWRTLLPHWHRVSALVVVHQSSQAGYSLPAANSLCLAWSRPESVVSDIRERLPSHPRINANLLVSLAAATSPGPHDLA